MKKKGINDETDFFKGNKRIVKGYLYDWNEGVDVEKELTALLRPGHTLDDVRDWLDSNELF